MKFTLGIGVLILFCGQARAEVCQIETADQMYQYMQSYISKWTGKVEQPVMVEAPAFESSTSSDEVIAGSISPAWLKAEARVSTDKTSSTE